MKKPFFLILLLITFSFIYSTTPALPILDVSIFSLNDSIGFELNATKTDMAFEINLDSGRYMIGGIGLFDSGFNFQIELYDSSMNLLEIGNSGGNGQGELLDFLLYSPSKRFITVTRIEGTGYVEFTICEHRLIDTLYGFTSSLLNGERYNSYGTFSHSDGIMRQLIFDGEPGTLMSLLLHYNTGEFEKQYGFKENFALDLDQGQSSYTIFVLNFDDLTHPPGDYSFSEASFVPNNIKIEVVSQQWSSNPPFTSFSSIYNLTKDHSYYFKFQGKSSDFSAKIHQYETMDLGTFKGNSLSVVYENDTASSDLNYIFTSDKTGFHSITFNNIENDYSDFFLNFGEIFTFNKGEIVTSEIQDTNPVIYNVPDERRSWTQMYELILPNTREVSITSNSTDPDLDIDLILFDEKFNEIGTSKGISSQEEIEFNLNSGRYFVQVLQEGEAGGIYSLIWDTTPVYNDDVTLPNILNVGSQTFELGFSNSVSWQIIDDYPSKYSISVNNTVVIVDESWVNEDQTVTFNVDHLEPGIYDIKIDAIDQIGNINSSTITVTILDTTLPILTNLLDKSFEYGMEVAFLEWEYIEIDPDTYYVYVNNTLVHSESNFEEIQFNMDKYDLGVYNVTLVLIDRSDNMKIDELMVIIKDSIAPVISIIYPIPGNVISLKENISINVFDVHGVQKIEYSWNSTANITLSEVNPKIEYPNIDGLYFLDIYAYDSTEHVGHARYSYILDSKSPDLYLSNFNNTVEKGNELLLEIIAIDENGIGSIEIYIDGILYSTLSNFPFTLAILTDTINEGEHSLSIIAYDLVGNIKTLNVLFTVNQPSAFENPIIVGILIMIIISSVGAIAYYIVKRGG